MIISKALLKVVDNLKRQVKEQIEKSGNPLEIYRGENMKEYMLKELVGEDEIVYYVREELNRRHKFK